MESQSTLEREKQTTGVGDGAKKKSQVLKERGNSYYVRHQFIQAIEWYTKAIEVNPEAYDVYTNRASTYAALEMWEDALWRSRESVLHAQIRKS